MGASYASETWGVPLGETWGVPLEEKSETWGDMGRKARHGEKSETWGEKRDMGSATV